MKSFAFSWFDHMEGSISIEIESGGSWKDAIKKTSLCCVDVNVGEMILGIVDNEDSVMNDLLDALCDCEISLAVKEIV